MKNDKVSVEEYITSRIDSGEWKYHDRIPTEKELIEATGYSKMTIRKAIDRLKSKEVLYSIMGSGVFVSPFAEVQRFVSIKKQTGATKVRYIPTTTDVPVKMLEKFFGKVPEDHKPENYVGFIKVYMKGKKTVAYSVNWINAKSKRYKFEIERNPSSFVELKSFDKVIEQYRVEPVTNSDRRILGDEITHAPTAYSYFIKGNKELIMMRVVKTLPQYYKYESIQIKD